MYDTLLLIGKFHGVFVGVDGVVNRFVFLQFARVNRERNDAVVGVVGVVVNIKNRRGFPPQYYLCGRRHPKQSDAKGKYFSNLVGKYI